MVWLVGALLLLWVALGPVVLVLAAALLAVPRVRWWVQDRAHVSRRVVAWTAATAATVGLLVVVVPDGWLPIPPAPGAWAGPSYVGRPASPHQVPAEEVPPNPHRVAGEPADLPDRSAISPRSRRRGSASSGAAGSSRPRPVSSSRSAPTGDGRALRVVDPETLRPVASQDLPDLPEDSRLRRRVPLPRRRRTGRGRHR